MSTIFINQKGYSTTGPKQATLLCDSPTPCDWSLVEAASGQPVASGSTTPRGLDPTVGAKVHTIDFSEVTAPGRYRLQTSCGGSSFDFPIADDLYDDVLADTVRVFTLQRSGFEITPEIAGPAYARAAGHLGVVPNQGDTAVSPLPKGWGLDANGRDLYSGWGSDPADPACACNYSVDASGGWYDAGDAGKYVVNGGISVAGLLGLIERAQRLAKRGGAHQIALPTLERAASEVTWELDWMSRMRVAEGLPYAGLVHHRLADEHWTGLPLLPADDPSPRYLHRPSTAATLNVAAVAAQAARVFANPVIPSLLDLEAADRLLALARSTYAAAQQQPRVLAPNTNTLANPGSGPYDDAEIDDEFYWAATELFLTTGEEAFLTALRESPYHLARYANAKSPWNPAGFDWQYVAPWAYCQLAVVDSPHAEQLTERAQVRAELLAQADRLIAAAEPFGQLYHPARAHFAWGSNGMVANNAVIVGVAAEISQDQHGQVADQVDGQAAAQASGQADDQEKYRAAAIAGLDYLFGRNALNLSYVTGHGSQYVCNQHSRWFAHSLDPALPQPPAGTLSGGPNSDCNDHGEAHIAGLPAQLCYVDDIGAFEVNEFTINWNAALALALAYASTL